MVDSHAHIHMISKNTDEVIERAKKEGVKYILCPSTSFEDIEAVISLSQRYEIVYSAIGIHPLYAENLDYSDLNRLEREILNFAEHRKLVAIGETGLDFQKGKNIKKQIEFFRKQIEIAEKISKPVIIHTRGEKDGKSAFSVAYEILKDFKVSAVFHCFSWGKEEMHKAFEKNFLISFSGNITFDRKLDEVIKQADMSRILAETDSPFLTPKPFRGKDQNEPSYVRFVFKKISEIKEKDIEEISHKITENFEEIFLKK